MYIVVDVLFIVICEFTDFNSKKQENTICFIGKNKKFN